MLRSLSRLGVVALLIAWSFDLLFWNKPWGVSFAIFVTLVTLGGLGLGFLEKRPPAKASLLLLLPLGFFSLMSFWRMEPFTTLVNVLLSLLCLAILAVTYRRGDWLSYGWLDYAWRMLKLALGALSKPIQAWKMHTAAAEPTPGTEQAAAGARPTSASRRKKAAPWLRGVVLALPVLLVFSLLLASADPVFGQGFEDLLSFLKIENLPENLFRLVYILIIGYLLAGVYLHALNGSSEEKLLGAAKPLLPRFLGFIEAAVVLGSVNLLFAAFVGVQFRYFFGGQGNIHLDGYTYAEYARRGFAELLLVAFFTLLLFLALSTVVKRNTTPQRWIFSILGALLTVLVSVILVSAYQRLLLYEAAYGFTRLRTYTHLFMLWLGVLLAVLMVLELSNRLQRFPLASLLVLVGFGISLNLLPVDGFIVRQNVQRASQGAALDSAYLVTLSPDSAGELWQAYYDPDTTTAVGDQLGAVLACQAAINLSEDLPWQSFNLSRQRARSLAQTSMTELAPYNAHQDAVTGQWVVTIGPTEQPCLANDW